MASVSQNGPRKPRPWTPQDQVIAEVAAACGVSFCEIGRAIQRHRNTVKRNLIPRLANKYKVYGQKWRELNREKDRESSRNYYKKNREKARSYGIAYRAANHQRTLERRRSYYYANKEEQKRQMRKWYQANKERVKEIVRRRKAMQRSSRRQCLSPLTLNQKIYRFQLWGNSCAYCGSAKKVTVDHVMPLYQGGHDQIDNVVPACLSCNCSKQARPVEAWYRRQPFFTDARWRKIQRHCPTAVAGQLPLSLTA
jgi:5-methylcytosine-specific restriction endonuclease McrA